jgi:hypothetical protein
MLRELRSVTNTKRLSNAAEMFQRPPTAPPAKQEVLKQIQQLGKTKHAAAQRGNSGQNLRPSARAASPKPPQQQMMKPNAGQPTKATGGAQKATSRASSPQTKPVHQKAAATSAKPMSKSNPSGEVIRLGSVRAKEAQDDAFESGSWLFDETRIPLWLKSELPSKSVKSKSHSAAQKPAKPTAVPSNSPGKAAQAKVPLGECIKLGSFHAKQEPDDTFYNGAWMFDSAAAPGWMKEQIKEIPKQKAKPTQNTTKPTTPAKNAMPMNKPASSQNGMAVKPTPPKEMSHANHPVAHAKNAMPASKPTTPAKDAKSMSQASAPAAKPTKNALPKEKPVTPAKDTINRSSTPANTAKPANKPKNEMPMSKPTTPAKDMSNVHKSSTPAKNAMPLSKPASPAKNEHHMNKSTPAKEVNQPRQMEPNKSTIAHKNATAPASRPASAKNAPLPVSKPPTPAKELVHANKSPSAKHAVPSGKAAAPVAPPSTQTKLASNATPVPKRGTAGPQKPHK